MSFKMGYGFLREIKMGKCWSLIMIMFTILFKLISEQQKIAAMS